jgi:hypothetical protein
MCSFSIWTDSNNLCIFVFYNTDTTELFHSGAPCRLVDAPESFHSGSHQLGDLANNPNAEEI